MSDFNESGGGNRTPSGEPLGATAGAAFGDGRNEIPGRAAVGQEQRAGMGGTSEPGIERAASPERPGNEPGGARETLHDDRNQMRDAVQRETGAARDAARAAAADVREGAASLASDAKAKLSEGAESGRERAASGLGDFAAAVRKASDELGQRDQSMAAGLMREVAGGIEQASNSIHGTNVQDLGRSVADFARRQPTTFLIGATLAGIALGRLARASGDHRSDEQVGGRAPYGDDGHPDAPGRREAFGQPRTFEREPPDRSTVATGSSALDERPGDAPGTAPVRGTPSAMAPSAATPGAVTPNETGFGSGSFPPAGGNDVR